MIRPSEMPPADFTVDELVNGLPAGVMVISHEGVVLHANRQAANLLELPKRNLAGRLLASLMPKGAPDVMKAIHSKRQAAGLALPELENCFIHLSPFAKPDQGAVLTIFDHNLWQPYFRAWSTTADPSAHYFKKIFEASSDGLTITNKQGYMVLVNQAAADNVGLSLADLQGRHVSTLIKDKLTNDIVSLEVIQKKRRISKFIQTGSGKDLLITATPIVNLDGEVTLVVINERDITAITKMEGDIKHHKELMAKFKEELNALSLAELKRQTMVAESPAMCQVLSTAVKLAHHSVSHILITGESGTGKGLLAQFIHSHSRRSQAPFVHINCAALPESLLEAELFGYEKGAFTGANPGGKAGLFELAQEGTVFLDEIGEMPLPLQAKILTFLDSQEFRRIGGRRTMRADCAIIAATNQDLAAQAEARRFRSDLYYRLRAFSLTIPPLRERPEDIIPLAISEVDKLNEKYKQNRELDQQAVEILRRYHFPGNVRELLNIMQQAVLLSDAHCLGTYLKTLPLAAPPRPAALPLPAEKPPIPAGRPGAAYETAVFEAERSSLLEALNTCRNTREMAASLGISQASVSRKLRKHGLTPPGRRRAGA